MESTAAAGPRALREVRRRAPRGASRGAGGARGAARIALQVEPAPDLAAARSEWTELARRSGNVFSTWEWADVWWRHYGDGLSPAVGQVQEGGATIAVLPLCLRGRRPLRLARFMGYGPADELGPVCASGDRLRAAEALRDSGSALGWDLLLAERLAPGHGLPGRQLQREGSPVVAAPPGGWEEYLAGRSRNLRSQLGRKERALRRDHGLRFRFCDDPARLDEDMQTLFRLHEARWGEEGSGALRGQRSGFHREFAAVALERGWLRLWVAEAGDRPVAAWYGFRFGEAESYYQSGRDPGWDRSSVGLVLLAHTIREAMGEGVREYRLLRGGESYKDRFATDDPGVETVAAGRNAAGRLAAAAGAAAPRLPGPLRRPFVRLLR